MFEDAFVASEALDWLHGFLKENPNFGADVTRQQAVQLCSKFLKNGIITDARGKQYNGMFEDNNHLYYTSHELRIGFQCKGLCKGPYTLTAVSDYNARYILRRLTLLLST